MRKLYHFFWLALVISTVSMLSTACDGKKASPEEEVRNYAKYFIQMVNQDAIDSLKITYPDLLKSDSIVKIVSDSVYVTETTPGNYDVRLAEVIKLNVSRSEDGRIIVIESTGLFAYPDDKLDLAKKTGLYTDSLNDVQLGERMKDDDFFKYLTDKSNKATSKILTIGKVNFMGDGGYQSVINNTDQPIKGSDYTVVYIEEIRPSFVEAEEGYRGSVEYTTAKGKDIPAHGRVNYEIEVGNHWDKTLHKINLKIPKEELARRFAPYTGNEYQEYLNSKK